MTFSQTFISQSIHYLEQNTPRIKSCMELLDDKEVWLSPGGASNSIGNLVLHLCGNITQYIISSLGHTQDLREREKEFTESGSYSRSTLIQKLSTTVTTAIGVIKNLGEEDLLRSYQVQGFELPGIAIVIHVIEHYSYHTSILTGRIKINLYYLIVSSCFSRKPLITIKKICRCINTCRLIFFRLLCQISSGFFAGSSRRIGFTGLIGLNKKNRS